MKGELNDRMYHITAYKWGIPQDSPKMEHFPTCFGSVLTSSHIANFYADRMGEFLLVRSRLMICNFLPFIAALSGRDTLLIHSNGSEPQDVFIKYLSNPTQLTVSQTPVPLFVTLVVRHIRGFHYVPGTSKFFQKDCYEKITGPNDSMVFSGTSIL